MEDVLAVYQRPYDPRRPVLCLDELLKELHGTPKGQLAPAPGKPRRQDCEYSRDGSCNAFTTVEPLAGRRHVRVTDRRTGSDMADELRRIAEELYPDAEKIVLVTDNLNIHKKGCLYDRFEPERAFAIAQRLEWHYTPKHASWLNMAEIELSVLRRQCLGSRMADKALVETQVKAWNEERNAQQVKIDWQFKADDARIKLKRLYPKFTNSI